MKITRLVVLAGDDVDGMLQIEQQLKRQHPDTIVMKSLPDEPLFIGCYIISQRSRAITRTKP